MRPSEISYSRPSLLIQPTITIPDSTPPPADPSAAHDNSADLDEQEVLKEKEIARLDRDELLHVLSIRRASIQHAADAVWPHSQESNRPVRKTFGLPLTRAMGM